MDQPNATHDVEARDTTDTDWISPLVATSFLAIFDVLLDIEEQYQLPGNIVIDAVPQVVRFRQLMPADGPGLRDKYLDLRLRALELLKLRGVVVDYDVMEGRHRWGTQVSIQITPAQIENALSTFRENYQHRLSTESGASSSGEGLDRLTDKGRLLLDQAEPIAANRMFRVWEQEVGDWLQSQAPNSGIKGEWMAQDRPRPVFGGACYDDPQTWARFQAIVRARMSWLSLIPQRLEDKIEDDSRSESTNSSLQSSYVDPGRIEELRRIESTAFDLSKLIRLCEELSQNAALNSYYSMGMTTRAIMDHVAPIFGFQTFDEAVNNYSGTKSFKESMQHLHGSMRKISDNYLHSLVRSSESLPNFTQVNCSNDLDVLLGEIVRLLKAPRVANPP